VPEVVESTMSKSMLPMSRKLHKIHKRKEAPCSGSVEDGDTIEAP
jgi:hypothetical protein